MPEDLMQTQIHLDMNVHPFVFSSLASGTGDAFQILSQGPSLSLFIHVSDSVLHLLNMAEDHQVCASDIPTQSR